MKIASQGNCLLVFNCSASRSRSQEGIKPISDLRGQLCYYVLKDSLPGGGFRTAISKGALQEALSPLNRGKRRYERNYRADFLLLASHVLAFLPKRRRSMNRSMSQGFFVDQIPANREGWIYLICAVGTNRYKVGRSSKSPFERRNTLQKQSPYWLNIDYSFWTIDTYKDEAYIHDLLREYRVLGEWFEIPESDIPEAFRLGFNYSFSITELAAKVYQLFRGRLYPQEEKSNTRLHLLEEDWQEMEYRIHLLFTQAKNKSDLRSIEAFMGGHLFFQCQAIAEHNSTDKMDIKSFFCGAISAYSFCMLSSDFSRSE